MSDTKAVARWDIGINGLSNTAEILWHYQGRYILFTDHERVVGDLTREAKGLSQSLTETFKSEEELRTALATSRAEVEGLKKDAERYRWLKDNCQAVADEHSTAGQLYFGTYLYGSIDSAIDAAMEKGNV